MIEPSFATPAMDSLPQFLERLVLRSQCWCFVSITGRRGFSVGSNDAILLYLVLKGSVTLTGARSRPVALEAGDMVAVLDRRPHAIRTGPNSIVEELPFLNSAQYIDTPPFFSLGSGDADHQVLCGRLKVRWPGHFSPTDKLGVIMVPRAKSAVNFDAVLRNSQGKGAAATLTHAGSMMLVSALQHHADFQSEFSGDDTRDPIARAIKLMEEWPNHDWTVSGLARQVGLGRTVFATRFVDKIGKPPFEVLTDLRMESARKLLVHTEMKLSEIAERVGYHSESAFHRRFTAHFQVPPGRMRCASQELPVGPAPCGLARPSGTRPG